MSETNFDMMLTDQKPLKNSKNFAMFRGIIADIL